MLTRITFEDGNVVSTRINGTLDEIKEYYAPGKAFNLGTVSDNMQRVSKCEPIEERELSWKS